MSKKKKVLIGVLVTILVCTVLFICLVTYVVVRDLTKEQHLKQEINNLWEMVYHLDYTYNVALNNRLNTYITSGSYLVVEKSLKTYMKDVVNNLINIASILNSDKIAKIVTIDNYKSDGPYFVKSRLYINETRKKLKEYKNKFSDYTKDEVILSYLNQKKVDSYYVDLYKELALTEENITANDIKNIEESIDEVIKILDFEEEILDFLTKNKDDWEIKNNKIYFKTDELIKQYTDLLIEFTS